MSESRRKFT